MSSKSDRLLEVKTIKNNPLEPRKKKTANVNFYHATKFSPLLSFTVHYFYKNVSCFTPVLSIRIVLTYLTCVFSILRNSQLKFDVYCKRDSKYLY